VNLTRGTFATVTNSRFIGRQARELIADDVELPLLSRGWLVRDVLMSPTGRLSASSNAAWWLRQQTVRAASAPVLPSSSPVTSDLPAHAATTDDAEWRRVLGRRMNGFNLVSGSLRGGGGVGTSRPHIYYTSNTAPGAPFELPLFPAGTETATGCVNAVSNSYLDCALEPRVAHLRHRLEQILSLDAGVGHTVGSSHTADQRRQADHAALADAIDRNDPIAVADALGAPLLDSLNIPTIPAADLLDVPRKYRRLAAALEGGESGPASSSPVGPGSDSDVGNDVVDFACPDAAREAALRVRVARALQQNVYTAPLLLPHGSPSAFKAFGTRTQIVVFVLAPPQMDEGEGAISEAPRQGATVHFCTRNVAYDGAATAGYDFRKGDPAPNPPVPRVTPWQHFSAPLALD
jgi:hypothetical protein